MNFKILDNYRVKLGRYGTKDGDDFGAFKIPFKSFILTVICAPMKASGWEHVSVSLENRCPNWEEMSYVKSLFWNEDQTCVQFFPKKSEYVNNCEHCLHIWRHKSGHELPPSILVGVK